MTLECCETMPSHRHRVSPHQLLARRSRRITSSSTRRSSVSCSKTSLANIPPTTPTRTFANSLRSAILSSSIGCPPMPFACGSFPSHLGIEQVTGCRTRSPTRSPLGRLSPRLSSVITFHLARLSSGGRTSHPLPRMMESHFTKQGRGSRTSSASAPTIEFLTGS